MVRQAHQQQCDDLNSVTEHSRSMPNGDAMSLPNGWETKNLVMFVKQVQVAHH